MRFSIELPADLVRDLKALAARRGVTLSELVEAAARRELDLAGVPGRRIKGPLVRGTPGNRISLTNAQIEDLLT